MRGAIFYTSKYGSTAGYAGWIGEASGLPVFNVDQSHEDPGTYDFLILACPILYYKPTIRKWATGNLARFRGKPLALVTVSGAPAGPKLDGWIRHSLPKELVTRMDHFALRGRQDPKKVNWLDWFALKIAAMFNSDPEARKQESQGFDMVDKSTIGPVVDWIRKQEATSSAGN